MRRVFCSAVVLGAGLALCGASNLAAQTANPNSSEAARACAGLTGIRNVTILSAGLAAAKGSTPEYCYVRGLIQPAIHFHMQLHNTRGLALA